MILRSRDSQDCLALEGQRSRVLDGRYTTVPHGFNLHVLARGGALVHEIAPLEQLSLLRGRKTVPDRSDAHGASRLQVPGVHRVSVLKDLTARAQVQPGRSE